MPDFCNCGAQLPPDALFCHKCGKPQRDLPIPETLEPPPEVVAPPVARIESMPPTFRNPLAIWIGLMVALIGTLLSVTVLPIVSWPGAGFFAVVLYRRRTGSPVNVGAGARLGMITGVLMAGMFSVLLIPEALSGGFIKQMEQQMKSFGGPQSAAALQMIHSLSGTEFAIWLLFCIIFAFAIITGLSAAGGALGAKIAGRG